MLPVCAKGSIFCSNLKSSHTIVLINNLNKLSLNTYCRYVAPHDVTLVKSFKSTDRFYLARRNSSFFLLGSPRDIFRYHALYSAHLTTNVRQLHNSTHGNDDLKNNDLKPKQNWVDSIKHQIHWIVSGSRLFGANCRVSMQLIRKKVEGHQLTLTEHKLLVRTVGDLFKLIPFSFFIIIPFAEVALPAALWAFPGMLPSTFTERTVDNTQLNRKLIAKQNLAKFFQELIEERTKHILETAAAGSTLKDRAEALQKFQGQLLKINEGGIIHTSSFPFPALKETLEFASLFKDHFQLESMDHKSLQLICRLLSIHPSRYPTYALLQLRHHIRRLQSEDRRLFWEGVDALTDDEVVDACRDRAMRFHGISVENMRNQLEHWLFLSSHPSISPVLLLWSRSITMTHNPMPLPGSEDMPTEVVVPQHEEKVPEKTTADLQDAEKRLEELREESRHLKEERQRKNAESAIDSDPTLDCVTEDLEPLRQFGPELFSAHSVEDEVSFASKVEFEDPSLIEDKNAEIPFLSDEEKSILSMDQKGLINVAGQMLRELHLLRQAVSLQNMQSSSILEELNRLQLSGLDHKDDDQKDINKQLNLLEISRVTDQLLKNIHYTMNLISSADAIHKELNM